MMQDRTFFTNYLPPEIIINILSRLPIRSVIRCMFVSKSWLDLVESPEFMSSHLSNSASGLAIFENPRFNSKPYKIVEFLDDRNKVFNFNFSLPHDYHKPIHSSVNGLIMLCQRGPMPNDLSVCNPITRDYIRIPNPREDSSPYPSDIIDNIGFGVSKKSGQFKIVRVNLDGQGRMVPKCEVYTLGTGSWRSITGCIQLDYRKDVVGAFLNGNLHWLAFDSNDRPRISCFDLETEMFTTFSPPPRLYGRHFRTLSALEGRLCLFDNSAVNEIAIWFMNEYRDDKSWTKEFVITKPSDHDLRMRMSGFLFPVKVYKDGDLLIADQCRRSQLFCYSSKTKTIRDCDVLELSSCQSENTVIIYTPSFLPVIKTMEMENVTTF